MPLRIWRFITLLLSALALTMTSAHLLELPQKMQYDASLYAAVNGSLYRYFAVVGGAYSVGAVLAAAVLAVLVRRHPDSFRWTAAGALGLALGLASWSWLVQPVNRQVASALEAAPASVPEMWQTLKVRWEDGHATGFVLQLLGFAALLVGVLVETAERPRAHRS